MGEKEALAAAHGIEDQEEQYVTDLLISKPISESQAEMIVNSKLKYTKKIKLPKIEKVSDKSQVIPYLKIKPVTGEVIVPPSIQKDLRNDWIIRTKKIAQDVKKCQDSGIFYNLKGQLITSDLMRVAKTGPTHMLNGEIMKDFEYMNTSQQNAVYGVLERHCAATTQLDPKVAADFDQFTTNFFEHLWDNGFKDDLISTWMNTSYRPISWV